MSVYSDAITYVQANDWSVIPIGNDKRPDFNKLPFNELGQRSWDIYNSRKPTTEELNAWFFSKPESNIAVVTGSISLLIVVDLDSDAMYNTAVAVAPVLRNTYTVKTRKGYHCYLNVYDKKYPTIVFSKDGVLNHIKGDGGYVLAPPSTHVDGKYYALGNDRPILSVSSTDVLVQLLKTGGFTFKGSNTGERRPVDWYEDLFDGYISVGERMTSAQSLTGLLRRYLDDKPGLVYHILDLWNNEYCVPPLPKNDIKNIVRSYYQLYDE